MFRRALVTFLLSLVFTMSLEAADPKADASQRRLLPFPAVEKTLPNGLKVIVVPTGFPNLVSIQIPVQTGSRNEVEPGKSGFAHFFEHMMFRGTKSTTPEQYEGFLTKAGARSNAYTTDDYTNYHTTFAKEDLETILRIEADRFQNLSYAEEAFRTEARAVLGEYNKNSAQPLAKLEEVMRDRAFQVHTYKHTTMGFLKDIEDMPNQFGYSKLFFDRWYRPENTTVIVAGDVDPAKVLPLVEKYWGGWARGSFKADIPAEPAPKGPVYAHVPWTSQTLPWIAVAFHGPAFSETDKEFAAVDLLFEIWFGHTSDVYRRLVQKEQKVDQLDGDVTPSQDPSLVGAYARLKKATDAVDVRNAFLETFAAARTTKVDPQRLKDAQSNARYSLARTLDNTDRIASTLARYVRFRRSFDTLDAFYRTYASVTPDDLLAAARKTFTDDRLVVTTLSAEELPKEVWTMPALASFEPRAVAAAPVSPVLVRAAIPQLSIKLQFAAGSAYDPKGKEGLAALAAAMAARGGSADRTIDEIEKALFPVAGSFREKVDKEVTTFTASIHRDNALPFLDLVLPQLLTPGLREEDFRRLKDAGRNALLQDLRETNEEELGKERLQANVFAGTPFGHPVAGTAAGIDAITLDDVRTFIRTAYTRGALTVGVSGDIPAGVLARLESAAAALPAGPGLPAPQGVLGRRSKGIEVEIVKKETRATAISFGFPISVTRAHLDFPALSVARAWLGEHRSSMSHLYQRIREVRGMNYGDYAYIEAFPRGMFQTFPEANVPRRAQLFEVWIRPVVPANAHMALRIAQYELEKLVANGLTREEFESTRDYLMKNVYLLTSTQEAQLGYALDSKWYAIGEYTAYMRDRLTKLTVDEVNRAIWTHLSAKDLSVVIITKDAEGLRDQLVSDAPSAMKYESERPKALLDEDAVIGARKLGIPAANIRITPVGEVFAK